MFFSLLFINMQSTVKALVRISCILCIRQIFIQGSPLLPFGEFVGDRILQKGDDLSVDVAISHPFIFLEQSYRQLFLGTNGYITFNQAYIQGVPSSFPLDGFSLVSAFWLNVNPGDDCSSLPGGNLNNNIFYREIANQNSSLLLSISNEIRAHDARYRSFRAQWAFILTYSRVIESGTFCAAATPKNTFQIVLATDGRHSFSILNYEKLEWIFDRVSNTYPFAGFNHHNGQYFRDIPGSRTANFRDLLTSSNVGIPVTIPGRWVFRLDWDTATAPDCRTSTGSQAISVSPKYGPIMGGNEITVSGCLDQPIAPTGPNINQIVCQFGDSLQFPGERHGPHSVRCVSPTPGLVGTVPLRVSVDNGATFPYASTYTFDEVSHSVKLIDQHSWASQSDRVRIQIQWNPYVIESDLDQLQNNSKVAVDLIGWYISGSDITTGIRTILIPLVPSATNTGRMDITLHKINFFRPEFPTEKPIFLRGALRVMKGIVRNALLEAVISGRQPENQASPSLWSPLFDIDILERLASPPFRNRLNFFDVPDVFDLVGKTVSYTVGRTINPLFGDQAFAAALFRVPDVLMTPDQWSNYFTGFGERQQLVVRILQCVSSVNFCSCWAAAERELLRYNANEECRNVRDFRGCPPDTNHARLDRNHFSVENPATSPSACNRVFTDDTTFWLPGSCEENPGAILCVTAASVSRKYSQQCCYGPGNSLILATSHPGGGRVRLTAGDRIASPDPGLVWIAKSLEEAITERMPLRKCCDRLTGTSNWNSADCLLFRQVRQGPGSQCFVQDTTPGSGHTDPHIVTYDGLRYTFNGLGEYVLLEIPDVITVQGRTSRLASKTGTEIFATVWSALALRAGETVLQISIGAGGDLDLYINKTQVNLDDVPAVIAVERSAIETKYHNGLLDQISANLVLGPFNIRLEVAAVDSILQFELLLPNELEGRETAGLLGRWNGDPGDDLWPRNQAASLPVNSSGEVLFNAFGETWRITKEESLFAYQASQTYETINDRLFRPVFETPKILNETLRMEAEALCAGNTDCMFDIAATGMLRMGQIAKDFLKVFDQDYAASRGAGKNF